MWRNKLQPGMAGGVCWDCKTWVPELGNPIYFVITFILPLFTNKKGKFFAIF